MGIRARDRTAYAVTCLSILTQRSTFPTFPDGVPGFGLILLRATVGVTLLYAGVSHLLAWQELRMVTLVVAAMSVICGVMLLCGLFNWLASSLSTLIGLGVAVALIPVPGLNFSSIKVWAAFTAVIAMALLCLGPGAYSLDARRYGRREIIIPARPHAPEDQL